jgi:deoxyribodipyrimidine photo-lyase
VTPDARIRAQNERGIDGAGHYVLYWMIAARRTRCNYGLQRAVEAANGLRKPLVILEALRVDYPHASDRLHAFVIQGMQANERACADSTARYVPYVEPSPGDGRGLLDALAARASLVVTDWYPAFFLPRMVAAAAKRCPVRLEAVDSNGLIPVATHGRAFPTARGYRGFMQRNLRDHLKKFPAGDPLARRHSPPGCPSITRFTRRISRAASAPPGRHSPRSSGAAWPATRTPRTIPTRTRPVISLPTCTSATSRRTRSFRRS